MALIESDKIFREIAEKSLSGIYLIQDGKFRYVNPRLAEIFGYAPDELTDRKGPVDLVLQADWHTVEENIRKRLLGESRVIHYDFRGKKKDGVTIYIEAQGFQTTYQGRPAVLGTLLDITDRKHAEEIIWRQRDFLQKTIESITHPFYVIDANDYSIVMANAASGLDSSSGKTCYASTHGLGKPCGSFEHPCPLEIVKKTKEATSVEHVHPDHGDTRIIEIHAFPIMDDMGSVTKMAEYSFDITERRHCEQKREELVAQLQDAISRIKTLRGMLPICSSCKKIRDDKGYWEQIESYVSQHSEAEFSHGICPECAKKLYPGFYDKTSEGGSKAI